MVIPQQTAPIIPLVLSYAIISILFMKFRREMRDDRAKAAKAAQKEQEAVSAAASVVSELASELEGIKQTVKQIEEWQPAGSHSHGINLNKRAQVLRMHRRGESESTI